jgi:hypothetical protein
VDEFLASGFDSESDSEQEGAPVMAAREACGHGATLSQGRSSGGPSAR